MLFYVGLLAGKCASTVWSARGPLVILHLHVNTPTPEGRGSKGGSPPCCWEKSIWRYHCGRCIASKHISLTSPGIIILYHIHLGFQLLQEQKQWRIRYVRRRLARSSTIRPWRCRRITSCGPGSSVCWIKFTLSRGASRNMGRAGRCLQQVWTHDYKQILDNSYYWSKHPIRSLILT